MKYKSLLPLFLLLACSFANASGKIDTYAKIFSFNVKNNNSYISYVKISTVDNHALNIYCNPQLKIIKNNPDGFTYTLPPGESATISIVSHLYFTKGTNTIIDGFASGASIQLMPQENSVYIPTADWADVNTDLGNYSNSLANVEKAVATAQNTDKQVSNNQDGAIKILWYY